MRRAVVTGAGIVSSLGNSFAEVAAALRAGVPRIVAMPRWAELGLRCQVAGVVAGAEELADRLELPRRNRLAMAGLVLPMDTAGPISMALVATAMIVTIVQLLRLRKPRPHAPHLN